MREIKLKVWDKEKQEFLPVLNLSGVNDYYNSDLLTLICQQPERFEKCLYTGLKDKNGKEIYEDDIISYMQNEDCPKEVYFKDGAFWPLVAFNTDTAIVILGNIYENPELLPKNK